MKKVMMLVFGLAMAIILVGCVAEKEETTGSKDETANKDEVVNYVKADEILERIENKETFAFILVDKTCSACQFYKETTLPEMKKELNVVYDAIELFDLESNEKDLNSTVTLIEEHLNNEFSATPTTYFMVDGVLKEAAVGALEYDALIQLHEKYIDTDSKDKTAVEEESVEDEKAVESDKE